jgi:very-long-chain ceramide synthase
MDWEAGQFKCPLSHYISTALLASLQGLNLFWLYYILRIAYRFVFYHVAEDDRSDNDENELAEEQRQDALSKSGADKGPGPKVLVNGQRVNGNGTTTAIDAMNTRKDATTNRKENTRKA